ncbi:copper chaperone PCu(A)C [Aquisediminimonas sediminicola]|uniref:copper chaperone PCu(A)C n=1 Tax=Alteraquisediminimonas sediminicola TaxID=2676787 RepID=UPI001C8D8179|nr:copper chaperone PCu(A)C [Aquisediminimonas sediminicola]
MRRLLSLIAPVAALALTACSASPTAEGPVTDAWVRLAAVEGNPAGGYFTLHGGATDNRLLDVTSPKVASIELHESRMQNGMMEMAHLDKGVVVPANATLSFAPGTMHAMMFGIAPEVKPGSKILLTFRFANGDPVNVEALVKAPGEDGGSEHMQH